MIIIIFSSSANFPGAHLVTSSLLDAVRQVSAPPLSDTIEGVFILGGSKVYKVYTIIYYTYYNHKASNVNQL